MEQLEDTCEKCRNYADGSYDVGGVETRLCTVCAEGREST